MVFHRLLTIICLVITCVSLGTSDIYSMKRKADALGDQDQDQENGRNVRRKKSITPVSFSRRVFRPITPVLPSQPSPVFSQTSSQKDSPSPSFSFSQPSWKEIKKRLAIRELARRIILISDDSESDDDHDQARSKSRSHSRPQTPEERFQEKLRIAEKMYPEKRAQEEKEAADREQEAVSLFLEEEAAAQEEEERERDALLYQLEEEKAAQAECDEEALRLQNVTNHTAMITNEPKSQGSPSQPKIPFDPAKNRKIREFFKVSRRSGRTSAQENNGQA